MEQPLTSDGEHIAIEIDSEGKPDVNHKKEAASSPRSSSGHFDVSVDDGLLHRAVEDAGRWAYGTVLAELWVWNDEHTALVRPDAGWWVDPAFHSGAGCGNGKVTSCGICRLLDPKRADYIPSKPVAAGVGLPGVLWTEKSRGKKIVWREVKGIANDPDQPYNPRLQLLGSIGLGWAAAVEFNRLGYSGLVIYMAREGVDLQRLQSESNEAYLLAASDFAASAYVLRGPRERAMQERRSELAAVLRRARNRILALTRMGINIEKLVEDNAAAAAEANKPYFMASFSSGQCLGDVQHRMVTVFRKALGGDVQPPPAMGWQQSLLTFFGCFVTLLALTRLNVHVNERLGPDYTITLPYVPLRHNRIDVRSIWLLTAFSLFRTIGYSVLS
jgi:hypothetical protein